MELSKLLQRMTLHPQDARQTDFRNLNGVGRKTADIARRSRLHEPTHQQQKAGKEVPVCPARFAAGALRSRGRSAPCLDSEEVEVSEANAASTHYNAPLATAGIS